MEKEELLMAYYKELDPDARMELLNQYGEVNAQDKNIALYRKLWKLRYVNPKNEQRVDTFLWQVVNLICLYRVSRFFKPGTEKEIKTAMSGLGFDEAGTFGEAGKKALYLEFKNAFRRYLGTCDSRAYGKKVMGLFKMNDDERANKIAREVWQLTYGLKERFNTGERMDFFCKACLDEFTESCPDAENLIKRQKLRHGKKRIPERKPLVS